jgi:hypothetical protein
VRKPKGWALQERTTYLYGCLMMSLHTNFMPNLVLQEI